MERDDRYSYCNICINRKKDGEFFICGLTDELATFEDHCIDFNIDKPELIALEKELEIKYEKINNKQLAPEFEIKTSNFNIFNIKDSIYLENATPIISEQPIKINFQNKKLIPAILISSLSVILILYFDPNHRVRNAFIENHNRYQMAFYILMFSSPLFLIYKYFDKRPILIIDSKGITLKTEQILWCRILAIYILETTLSDNSKAHSLIIHRHEEFDPIIVPVTNLTETPFVIIRTIYKYESKYKKNWA